MASPTKKVRLIRKRKQAKSGRKRKTAAENNGSTRSYAELFGDEE